jgi:hypothetical protein
VYLQAATQQPNGAGSWPNHHRPAVLEAARRAQWYTLSEIMAQARTRIRGALLAAGLLVLPPSLVAAEDDAAAGVQCVRRTLPILAAEVSGLRLQCEVVGAPSGDQDFVIELDQLSADVAEAGAATLGRRRVCIGSLSSGVGTCSGAVFNTASPAFGGMRVSATLLPSGKRLEEATTVPPAVSPSGDQAPLVFDPLPTP